MIILPSSDLECELCGSLKSFEDFGFSVPVNFVRPWALAPKIRSQIRQLYRGNSNADNWDSMFDGFGIKKEPPTPTGSRQIKVRARTSTKQAKK